MNLYELTTGYIGESYERSYAWAESEEHARQLFDAMQQSMADRFKPCKCESCTLLFSAKEKAFVTKPSDSGWHYGLTGEIEKFPCPAKSPR
jgi:hypothetical protein